MCKLADFQCTNNNNRVILIIIKRRQPLLPHEMHIKFPIIRILRVCVCVCDFVLAMSRDVYSTFDSIWNIVRGAHTAKLYIIFDGLSWTA